MSSLSKHLALAISLSLSISLSLALSLSRSLSLSLPPSLSRSLSLSLSLARSRSLSFNLSVGFGAGPLASGEGPTGMGFQDFRSENGLSHGLDWLICSKFAWQRVHGSESRVVVWGVGVGGWG